METVKMDNTTNDGLERLRLVLRRIANLEQVAAGLGIADPASQTEEFWQGQRRAARRRLLQLCLQELGWDQSLDLNDLDDRKCHAVADTAEQLLLRPGFDYALVRRWFRARGQFQYNKAIALVRERNYLANTVLRVLVVLNAGGAQFLAFGPGADDSRLVAEPDAHEFQVSSSSEIEKPYLLEMAKHFAWLLEKFEAKEIKVLPGAAYER